MAYRKDMCTLQVSARLMSRDNHAHGCFCFVFWFADCTVSLIKIAEELNWVQSY